jgi:hypothetical protein
VAKSAHRVRKIGAAVPPTTAVTELEAICGWQGGGMASFTPAPLIEPSGQKGAMAKLTTGEQSIPPPRGKVRDRVVFARDLISARQSRKRWWCL